jgi:hypothetical protein
MSWFVLAGDGFVHCRNGRDPEVLVADGSGSTCSLGRAVPKRRVWDLKSMNEAELRSLVHRCNHEEQRLKAPYKKGRKGWVELRGRVQTELERRGLSPE